MLAQTNIPEVVDMAGGVSGLISVIAPVVLVSVGGYLAYLVVRRGLRQMHGILEYSDRDYARDRWRHAHGQRKFYEADSEGGQFWAQEEKYWQDRYDRLSH